LICKCKINNFSFLFLKKVIKNKCYYILMEINLFHAFFGRFAVLIPILAFFFEIAVVITQKPFLNKFSSFLILFSSTLVIIASLSGFQEFSYLSSKNDDKMTFHIHYLLSSFITVGFIIIILIRIYLLKKVNEKLTIFYMIFLTVLVILNLFNNEYIIHILRGN